MLSKKPARYAQKRQADEATPYKTGTGSYNRESGRKTLLLVAGIIALIAACTTVSLILLNK